MKRAELFKLLRHNNQLGYRRSPAFEQSMIAKVLMIIGGGVFVLYLILYGTMFAYMAASEHEPSLLLGIMPLMLVLDFGIRFVVQQTPAMLVKPYLLMPLPRHAIIEIFLLSSIVSTYNWLWLAFFLPYFVIVLAGGGALWMAISLLVGGMLLMMANSQFYLIVRTLVARNLFWWALPTVVYGAYWSTLLLDKKGDAFESLADALVAFGSSPWLVIGCAALLAVLFGANRHMQFAFVREEIERQERTEASGPRSVSQYSFLECFGEMGEYLKLELKSIFRCKAIRSRFIMSLALIIFFSLFVAYTSIYDNALALNFLCYYCFALYGATSLVKIMGPEGNYIDLLMVQRENILMLLRAKYYFHCAILLVPLLVMLPAVIEGKFSILMMLAYLFLASGLLYAILFQLAVYNKQTLPLDQKITGKGNIENGLQLILEMVGLFLPILLMTILLLFFQEQTAYLIAIVFGVVITLLHPLWLHHVYGRMMKRKYENLEGFHATR